MIYYYRRDNIERNHTLFCVYQSNRLLSEEEKNQINEKQNNLLDNTIIYDSPYPFIGYPILDRDILRPATVVELINLGLQELKDGEYIENGELITVNRPSWQYSWDKNTHKWYADETKLYDGQIIQNNNIVKMEYSPLLEYAKPIWDKQNKSWIDKATQEEKLDFYKKRIIETNKELLAYEVSGFDNLELKKSLEKLISLHNELAFEVATIQNMRMK